MCIDSVFRFRVCIKTATLIKAVCSEQLEKIVKGEYCECKLPIFLVVMDFGRYGFYEVGFLQYEVGFLQYEVGFLQYQFFCSYVC